MGQAIDSVFVDTSAWYALSDSRDPSHPMAGELIKRLKQAGRLLYTSEWVFLETVAVIASRVGARESREVGSSILSPEVVTLLPLEPQQRDRAWSRYLKSPTRLSLVDCSSFVIMEELGVAEAFAFDDDFEKAGFKLLRAN